jgi:lactoylglutathione lyase
MRIEHIAIWTHQLERLQQFYETYFDGRANAKYVNPRKQFESYFITFAGGARLELMQMPTVPPTGNNPEQQFTGYVHIAFSASSREAVDALTERLGATAIASSTARAPPATATTKAWCSIRTATGLRLRSNLIGKVNEQEGVSWIRLANYSE